MTGRRLYEIVTDSLYAEEAEKRRWQDRNVSVGNFVDGAPVAFAYLPLNERDAWNTAARRVTPTKRKES